MVGIVVLGRKEIDAIRADIACLVILSCVTKPPPDFGSPSQGKLKADIWCTICTICLPTTLIRLWGLWKSRDHSQQLVDNFMDLVQAIILASSRMASKQCADLSLFLMQHYQEGILELFPNKHRNKPNLHATLHLPELLLKFGPPHAWWTFPFERLIGHLQQLNTNHKLGAFRHYSYTLHTHSDLTLF